MSINTVEEELKKLVDDWRQKVSMHDAEGNAFKNCLKELEHALSLLPKSSNYSFPLKTVLNHTSPLPSAGSHNEVVTDVEKTRRILEQAGAPLHINDIVGKLGIPEKKVSLTGTLNKYSKLGRTFKKTGPGTFGLIGRESINHIDKGEK